jgi:hypothetical protein
MNEKLWREQVEWDAVFLELAALGLNNVHLVGDGVDESAKLRFAALEDVDTASKDYGVLGHEEESFEPELQDPYYKVYSRQMQRGHYNFQTYP